MAVADGKRSCGELIAAFFLALIIGFFSSIIYVWGLIKHGPKKWLFVKPRNDRPDVLDSEQYGQHHWIPLKRSRVRLHYVVNGPKDKPLMLFVHGFPEFWYAWRFQLKEFSKDYRVVAVDMRGYGDSDKPRGIDSYTVEKLTDDIDQLIQQLGYETCILVGHDWGGIVAWYYALLHHDVVDKLIICNCPHPAAAEKHIRSSFSQVMKSWYIFLFQVPVLPVLILRALDLHRIKGALCGKGMGAKSGTFNVEDVEAYKYTFAGYYDLCAPVDYYRALMRCGTPPLPSVKFPNPTLMIWGTNDGALEKEMAVLSGNYVENYSLHFVEGASHWVQQEEPEQVNSFIREFLDDKKAI